MKKSAHNLFSKTHLLVACNIFFLIFLFLFPLSSQAAFEEHLTWKSEVEKTRDNEYKVKFICTMDEGWHIYSQKTEEGGPWPTKFKFEDNKDIELVGPVEEMGKVDVKFDELFGVKVATFTDEKVTFVQKVRLKNPAAVFKGEFDGQVCKDQCILFGPEKFSISFDGKAGAVASATNDTVAGARRIDSAKTDTTSLASVEKLLKSVQRFDTSYANNFCSVHAAQEDKSYWWIFIAGFLGGLLALLTPCVFPMVPLTVSFFTKNGKDKEQGLRKALIYGISIIVIYVLLGIIITGVFGSDALNAMSTNIWFNLLFFIVFVIFAFSFFGYYEITLPASWANKSDSLSSRGGNIGIFFMAFTLALVSFSCTGPIIGTLLVEAATGGGPALFSHIPLKPLLGMFGFSLALALPFTLFALFPQWLQSLPKSGGWLNTVKVILGFLELALAFKFLSVVDLTQNWGLFRIEIFLGIWILIFALMALYCFGVLRFPHDNPKEKPGKIRLGMGVLSAAFVFYLATGFSYRPLTLLSGLAPPSSYNFKKENKESFTHFTDYNQGMAYAKAHDLPILLDFTGFGCVNCRKIEENVWSDKNIQSLMQRYVVISLYVDDRKPLEQSNWFTSDATGKEKEIRTVGGKWSDFQARYFKTNAQPQYVLINSKEQLLNQPVDYSFSSDKKNYASFLNCGLDMHEKLK
jgi:thiol:disulfide interchange protein DsbD